MEYKQRKKEQIESKHNPPRGVWDQLVDSLGHKKTRITEQIRGLDADKSGSLSYWEFSQGLKKLGLRFDKKQTELLINALDADGDGEVCYYNPISIHTYTHKYILHPNRHIPLPPTYCMCFKMYVVLNNIHILTMNRYQYKSL